VKFSEIKPGESVKKIYKKGELEGYEIFLEDPIKYQQSEFEKYSLPKKIISTAWIGVSQAPTTVFHAITSPFTGSTTKDLQKQLALANIQMDTASREYRKGIIKTTLGVATGKKEIVFEGLKQQTPFVKETFLNPMAQEIYFAGAASIIGKAASPVTKSIIKTGVKSYSKVSGFIPEESIYGKVFKKTAQGVIKTDVGENVYKWAVKGYKPGLRLATATGSKPPVRDSFRQGDDIVEWMSKKTFEGGGGKLKRVFISPKEYTGAQKFLQTAKTSKPKISINFPRADIYRGVGSLQMDFSRTTTTVKGLFEPRIVTTTYSGSITRNIGVKLPTLADDVTKLSKYSGYEFDIAKKGITTSIDDIFTGTGITPLKPYKARYLIDYIDDVPVYQMKKVSPRIVLPGTRPSKISAFAGKEFTTGYASKGLVNIKTTIKFPKDPVKTFFGSAAERTAKTYTKSYNIRHPLKYLLGEKTATQTLVKTPKVTITPKASSVAYGRAGLVMATKSKYIPAISIPLAKPIVYTGLKIGGMTSGKTDTEIDFVTIPRTSFDTKTLGIPTQKTIQQTKQITSIAPISITSVTPTTTTIQAQDIVYETKQQTFGKVVATSKAKTQTYNVAFPRIIPFRFPYIPGIGMGGRGRRGYKPLKLKTKYKFREFKIPDIGGLKI